MLPIVDKPLIQYAVEEAVAAGIERLVFVTGRRSEPSRIISTATSSSRRWRQPGKHDLLDQIEEGMPQTGQIAYTRQQTPLGLGHAVWCARSLVGTEPFAVLLADDLMVCDTPCLAQMVDLARPAETSPR